MMRSLSLFAVLLCAAFAWATDEDKRQTDEKKLPLHKHPTIVKMLKKNNEMRERNGLRAQTIDSELTKLAQKHAQWMASTRNFQHNYNHGYAEIIYYNAGNVDQAFEGWMNSGPHRSIILSGEPQAGFGYAISESGETYWVGVYGARGEATSGV